MKKLIALLAVVVLLGSFASAQDGMAKKGSWGAMTEVSGTGKNLGVSYWLADDMSLGVNLGFKSSSPPSPAKSTSMFNIGAGIWKHMDAMGNLSPFIGGAIGIGSDNSSGTDVSSFNIAGQMGAEYFMSKNFSVAGWLQLGFGSAGPSGSTTSTISTSTGTQFTWYWN